MLLTFRVMSAPIITSAGAVRGGYVEAAQEPLKLAGRVTLLLTAPVQPFEQDTASFLD